jgi:fatty-acyl-CoA synthase
MGEHRGAHLLTLDRLFERAFTRYGERVALRFRDQTVTYAALDEQSAQFANVYRSLGLTADDRVGLLMENRPEFVAGHIGAIRAGTTVVPLNSELNDAQLRSLVHMADLDTLVLGETFFDIVHDIQQETSELNYVIGRADAEPLPIGFHDLSEVLDRADTTPPAVSIDPADTAAVYYTSGTTGDPKGVVHAHRPLTLNAYAHIQEFDIHRNERMLLTTPLSHSAEPFTRAGLAQGATIVIEQGFESSDVLETVESQEITWLYLIPTMIAELLEDERLSAVDTDSLETLVYGAAPIPKPVLRDGIEEFGQIFVQFYGLTEVPNLITVLPKEEHDPDDEDVLTSAGYPTQLVEVTLLDLAADWADDVGEIAVRSPYALVEYTGEETAYTGDGWLRTGDVGRIEDGRVLVLDRIQDVVVVDGEPVYSTVIENAIQRHPDVKQVAVIGVPANDSTERGRDRTAQSVKAVVTPVDGASIDAAGLREFCRDHLDGGYPDSVDVVGQLPETPYGKIDKQALRDPYW